MGRTKICNKNNKINGQGTFLYQNGDKYVGEFKNEKFHGQGILTYKDGRVDQGIWKDDKLVESTKLIRDDNIKRRSRGARD